MFIGYFEPFCFFPVNQALRVPKRWKSLILELLSSVEGLKSAVYQFVNRKSFFDNLQLLVFDLRIVIARMWGLYNFVFTAKG